MNAASLCHDIREGKVAAISRAITTVENRLDGYLSLLTELYRFPRHSYIIGVSGAPGSGKSSFCNHLVQEVAKRGDKIAVIAIDPSSRFSGGAFLGDRIRFADALPFDRVFFRSMASKWSQGSTNPSLFHVLQVLNAARYDWVLVESVGAGQNDMALGDYVDLLALLLVGGMGDEIQCMKAGIMEIADLFVINKIDIHPPEQLRISLANLLSVPKAQERVVETDSLKGKGFDDAFLRMDSLRARYFRSQRDVKGDTELILSCELERFLRSEPMQQKLKNVLEKAPSPYHLIEKMEKSLDSVLGKFS